MRLAVLVLVATSAVAHAGPDRGRDYVLVDTGPPPGTLAAAAAATKILYLNRCDGGCTILPGGNSARTDHSSIINDTFTLSEFDEDQATWDAMVACVRDAYRPYDIEIVTDEPGDGELYNEVMVAGEPEQLGQSGNTLGVSPMSTSCTPQSDWIAFAFANAHSDPIEDLCDTTAHEAGHIFGLDHEFDCKDKMTYLTGCSAKWFLNRSAPCGEFEAQGEQECQCTGDTQNSHAILTEIFGAGELPPPPEVTIPYPLEGAAVIPSFTMFGEVVEPRITDRVEFWLNGWPWEVQTGVREGTTYSYTTPASLPDGIIDLEVRAYNDLQLAGIATVTVTKGEPCTSASTCLDGQFCEDGRCTYPPPTGELGEACEIDADCISRKCGTDGEVNLCTAYCQLGADDACEDGYSCLSSGDDGLCWPSDRLGGGCCSAGGGAGSGALAGLVLAFLLSRGRRSPAPRSRS